MIIETGGKQQYIFDTNRLRHAVGASQLVQASCTDWVREAADELTAQGQHVESVLLVSGRAHLLVEDPETGRELVRRVSLRALGEAPGLEVTGVVGVDFEADRRWRPAPIGEPDAPGTFIAALRATGEEHARVRALRPAAVLRDPLLPWVEQCRESAMPAADHERWLPREAAPHPVSAGVLAKSAARQAGRDRVTRGIDHEAAVPKNIDEIVHDGWVAVIHADGDGIGRAFLRLPEALCAAHGNGSLSLTEYAQLSQAFSDELDEATISAMRQAVGELAEERDLTARVLPIVIAGDDVTVVCDGQIALDLTQRFLSNFAETTAQRPVLTNVLAALPEPDDVRPAPAGLTASAGIAYVKPHHPFSAAYELAEQLTASAKRIEGSAFDLHVCFNSTIAPLNHLRSEPATDQLRPWGGPYRLDDLDQTRRIVAALPSRVTHDLREALALSAVEYERRLLHIGQSPDYVRLRDELAVLAPRPRRDDDCPDQASKGATGPRSVLLLDAMLLNAIARPAADGSGPDEETDNDAADGVVTSTSGATS